MSAETAKPMADPLDVQIESVAHGGHGVGRVDGQVVFVPGALPGDGIRARVTRRMKNMIWADIVDVTTPSPHRAAGQAFDVDGAHSWLHFTYPAQAEWKRRIVAESLSRLGGTACEVGWDEMPELRLGYRTRATFHGDGKLFGYYRPGTHEILDMPSCPLCHPKMNAALAKLREVRLKGSCTVTVNPEGDEVLVWTNFPMRRLKQMFPGADYPGEDEGRAEFTFDGRPIVNGAFSQSSLLLNRMLLRHVSPHLAGAERVLDLYCGNGNLTIDLPEAAKVQGLDHSRPAVQAAARLRKKSYRFGTEPDMIKFVEGSKWDAIVLDPPRSGAKAIVPALAKSGAGKIVYVSCDPATLARDIRTLASGGWQLRSVTALDLFPNTAHVETVCVLEPGA